MESFHTLVSPIYDGIKYRIYCHDNATYRLPGCTRGIQDSWDKWCSMTHDERTEMMKEGKMIANGEFNRRSASSSTYQTKEAQMKYFGQIIDDDAESIDYVIATTPFGRQYQIIVLKLNDVSRPITVTLPSQKAITAVSQSRDARQGRVEGCDARQGRAISVDQARVYASDFVQDFIECPYHVEISAQKMIKIENKCKQILFMPAFVQIARNKYVKIQILRLVGYLQARNDDRTVQFDESHRQMMVEYRNIMRDRGYAIQVKALNTFLIGY